MMIRYVRPPEESRFIKIDGICSNTHRHSPELDLKTPFLSLATSILTLEHALLHAALSDIQVASQCALLTCSLAMLPSFASTFSSSSIRSSRPSPPIETQIDSSDHLPLSNAPRRPSPQHSYALPPIEHIDSRVTSRSDTPSRQQRRQYSNSVSAVDAPSFSLSQFGRKRSHDVATRHDVVLSSPRSTTPSVRDVAATGGMSTPRHPNERPIQDAQRHDSDTVDSENVDHIRCVCSISPFSSVTIYASSRY